MTWFTNEFRPETLVAIDAVKRGLAIARCGIGADDITGKGGRDLVTVTDVDVEDAVRGMVADALEDGKSKGGRREQAARFTAAAIRADRWDFRSLGTTLVSPYLAAGRISAYVVFWVSAIHTGAGSLLVTEAGGTSSDLDGRPWTIRSDSFVGSADPDLHEELLARAASNLAL
jgi:myo-inositol-1(or 4)-monophosphatase